jgi:uncharacterized membrane protein YozB (DUF420 family)
MRIMFVLQAIGTILIGSIIGLIINWYLMTIVLVYTFIYGLVVTGTIYITKKNTMMHNKVIQKATTVCVFISIRNLEKMVCMRYKC